MKTSKGLRKWRKGKKRGAIMKPGTFESIMKKAAKKYGKDRASKIAGAAYWKTAKKKYQKAKKVKK